MKKSLQLSEQRKILKREITELIEKTLPANILKVLGSFIQKLTRQANLPPWYISTILLGIIALLPQVILALILKQPDQVIGSGLSWSLSVILAFPTIPMVYLLTEYILVTIRDRVIDNINEKHDLDDLQSFLRQIGNRKKWLFQAFITGTLWSIVAIPVFSYLRNNFIGPSWSIDVWVWGFCVLGIGGNFLRWFLKLPGHIEKYHFNLYELNPSRSEVITHISSLCTRPFLVGALYLAIGTWIASLFEIFIWVIFIVVVAFWIPLIVQFFNSQTVINKIISSKKWQTLNTLQDQIRKHKNNTNLNSPEEVETINKLMDLHEKVYDSRNTQLTINSIFDFLNQLLLPLLAFIISNYDIVLKFFNLRP